jgi:hypothetical protein
MDCGAFFAVGFFATGTVAACDFAGIVFAADFFAGAFAGAFAGVFFGVAFFTADFFAAAFFTVIVRRSSPGAMSTCVCAARARV